MNILYEILVLGLGNLLMSDDGLGIHVVNNLKQKVWPPKIEILEVGTSIMNYLDEISRSRIIIAVDAVQAGGKPGSVYRLISGDIVQIQNGWRNSHGFSLLDVIELAREITGRPTELIIYGVEPLDLSFGSELSPPVTKALPVVTDEVIKRMKGEN